MIMRSLYNYINIQYTCTFEESRGAGAQSVTVKSNGCGFDPRSRKYLFKFIFPFFALVSSQSAASRVGNGGS